MSIIQSLPFNLDLLILDANQVKGVKQIEVLDIFEPSSTNFHPKGLFSVDIFGKVGDEIRNRMYAYIDMGTEVFHPLIYKELVSLKELYGKIINGTAYAVFDPKLKDFVASDMIQGKTGFQFFLSHFKELQFEERPSTSRSFSIKFINRYRDNATMRYLIVQPAGLRDMVVKPNGQREEDDINTFYRQALSIGNIAKELSRQKDTEQLDALRSRLQLVFLNLYQYLINMTLGDGKLIQAHWVSRTIFNTSRNVITSAIPKPKRLFDERNIGMNDNLVGLYQYIRGVFPVFVFYLRQYASKVFTGPNTPALLVNRKTLAKEQVTINPIHYDQWFTQVGVEGLLNQFETPELRDEAIEIEGNYFGLLYRDEKVFKFFQDIAELPSQLDRKKVKPITFAELFYLVIAQYAKTTYSMMTRYPVINNGGVYPGKNYLKTTVESDSLRRLDDQWQVTDEVFQEFPILGRTYFSSLSPPTPHLARAGADFDGDMMDYEVPMTMEAIEEISSLLKSANYYVGVDGRMNYSVETVVNKLLFQELSA